MDDRYLDVLDASGRTPRESGAVQFFADACVQDTTGAGMLTVYLQSAYEPFEGGSMVLYAEGEDGSAALPESQTRFALPPLPNGRVARWDIPLRFRSKAKTMSVEVEAPLGKKAERVRQPWKVFATHRALTNDEMDGVSRPPPPDAKEEPLGAFFGVFGDALSSMFGAKKPKQDRPATMKIAVTAGVPTPLARDSVEKVWELGEAMPVLSRRADGFAGGTGPAGGVDRAGADTAGSAHSGSPAVTDSAAPPSAATSGTDSDKTSDAPSRVEQPKS